MITGQAAGPLSWAPSLSQPKQCNSPTADIPTLGRTQPSVGSGKRKKRERGDPPLPPNLAQCAEPYRDHLKGAFALGPVYKPRCCRRCSRASLPPASYAPFYVTASLWENGVRSPLPPPARGSPAPPDRGRVTKAKPNSRHFAYGLGAQPAPAERSESILQHAERLRGLGAAAAPDCGRGWAGGPWGGK